ncbi:MAG: hypothetical protein WC379_09795 [Methanoregula sp.]
MTDAPIIPAGCPGEQARYLITLLFRAILAVSIALALMILLIPGPAFLAISNYVQILAALAGSLVFLYCWSRCGHQEAFLWAASGLGIWGIANIAWYVNVLLGLRALVFPSLIDLCMIASFLLLARGFRIGFPAGDTASYLPIGIAAASLIIPAAVIVTAGINLPTLVTLLYFLACGIFLAACIRYPGTQHAALVAGSVLFALAFMIYPLREMFFVQAAFLNIIGTLVSAGFALIVPGWMRPVTEAYRSTRRPRIKYCNSAKNLYRDTAISPYPKNRVVWRY